MLKSNFVKKYRGFRIFRIFGEEGIPVATQLGETVDMDMVDAVSEILLFLDEIKRTSKKIGNSQRCFFYYFFKALFDKERQEFLQPLLALNKAKQDYNRDYL